MSVQTLLILQNPAKQTLLRDKDFAMSSLEELPTRVFPGFFKDAFTGRNIKLMKAMMADWPFPCLPLGALMVMPDLETLKAVLNGVDM